MIKALLMIFAPSSTWERIARARRNLGFIIFFYLLPTVALSILGELDGRIYLSGLSDDPPKLPSAELTLRYGGVEIVSFLLVTFLGARLVKMFAETFHSRNSYTQCFTVTAYGLGPFFLLHLANAIPRLNPWIPLAVGVVFSFSMMYYAVPHVLKPDPPHAFGLYLMSGIILATLCGITRFLTLQVLHGRIVIP